MANIKPVLPSSREKKRYVAFEIISENKKFSFQDVSRTLWNSLLLFLGELEFAKAGIIVIANTFDEKIMRGLIRVNNKYLAHLKGALTLISGINEQPVIFRVLGVSGIVNKALKKYMVCR